MKAAVWIPRDAGAAKSLHNRVLPLRGDVQMTYELYFIMALSLRFGRVPVASSLVGGCRNVMSASDSRAVVELVMRELPILARNGHADHAA